MGLDDHKISSITNQDLVRLLKGDKSVFEELEVNQKRKSSKKTKSKKFVADFVNGGCSKKYDDSIF